MSDVLTGAAAGLTATAPMTAVMTVLHRQLPARQRRPLPPQQITAGTLAAAGIDEAVAGPAQTALALAGHFGYGALCEAAYGPLARRLPGPGLAKGAAYGLGVWAVSYLGWVPAAGLLPSATRAPAGRNALMIPAHLVWGGVLGILTEAVQRPTPGAEPEPVETERVERLPRPEPVGPVHQPGT